MIWNSITSFVRFQPINDILRLFAVILFLHAPLHSQVEAVEIPNYLDFALPQSSPSTCWAACNRMLLKSVGIMETELDQIERLKPYKPDCDINGAGGDFTYSKAALGGIHGNRLVIPYDVIYDNDVQFGRMDILKNSLKKGIPAVTITSDGRHGVVIYGAGFNNVGGQTRIEWLKIIDPAPPTQQDPQSPHFITIPKNALGEFKGFMTIRIEEL